MSAEEELSLELEAEQDRLRLIERLKASDNIYEQAECLQGLVLLLGRDGEIPWTDSKGQPSSDSSGSIRLETLLNQLWEKAAWGCHWVAAAGLGLARWWTQVLRNRHRLLIRQKQILVSKAYGDSLITGP